jgi:hypothetical protein
MDNKLSPTSKTAKRYNVCTKTIQRWRNTPELGFPAPVIINGRPYDRVEELDEFDRRNTRKAAAQS